jgi:ribosomal protein S21
LSLEFSAFLLQKRLGFSPFRRRCHTAKNSLNSKRVQAAAALPSRDPPPEYLFGGDSTILLIGDAQKGRFRRFSQKNAEIFPGQKNSRFFPTKKQTKKDAENQAENQAEKDAEKRSQNPPQKRP